MPKLRFLPRLAPVIRRNVLPGLVVQRLARSQGAVFAPPKAIRGVVAESEAGKWRRAVAEGRR